MQLRINVSEQNAAASSQVETLLLSYHITRCHSPENHTLHNHFMRALDLSQLQLIELPFHCRTEVTDKANSQLSKQSGRTHKYQNNNPKNT
jgi:hypothetical protein